MQKKYIVGIGEALWDVFPDGKRIGGAPANFAYHVSQFGLQSMVVSAVGKDALGDEIISIFKSKNLNYIVPQISFLTGTVKVTIDAAGIPDYNITENVAWDNIPMSAELLSLAKDTCAVCFGSLAQRNECSRRTINEFLNLLPSDATLIFDINLRQNYYNKDIIEKSLNKCNILKINEDELAIVVKMFGITGDNYASQCEELISKYSLDALILTCGENGSYVFADNFKSFIPTPKVQVADTVGAGDSFTAAFVSSLLQGKDLRTAHQIAVKVSAYVCTQTGAMPTLPEKIKSIITVR